MKSSLLIITLIFCLSASAQIQKGVRFVGGSINFFNQNERPNNIPNVHNSSSNLIIAPSYGKAVKQNLILGFDLSYQYQRFYANDTSKYKIVLYGADFLVRKYKYLGKNFYLFGETTFGGYLNYRKLKSGNTVVRTDSKGYGIELSFTPGISYAINHHLQLETKFYSFLNAGYSHTKFLDVSNPYSLNSLLINSSLSSLSNLAVGLRIWINR